MDTTPHYPLKQLSPQLLVANMDRAIAFYTKMLGFTVDFRYEDFYCGIVKDGWSIHLKVAEVSIAERKNRRDNEHTDLTFAVEGIEDLYREMAGMQVEIVQPLREMPYGTEFYIADPDGYVIAFLE